MGEIIKKNICKAFEEDASRYALYVNRRRALPDIRDGLKPFQRRVIYAGLKDVKCFDFNHKVKSQELVGAVIGKYHPHGDAAVYDGMSGMVNWFKINVPLLIGEGGWGDFQGNKASASRYTETFLSPFTLQYVIGDLIEEKDIVDYLPTYNDVRMEPEYFPVKVPLLLLNGNFGIGYGMAMNIPTHNVNEVIDATINLIHNPQDDVVLVPDSCMECEIVNTDWKSICNLGKGSYISRGIIDTVIEKNKITLVIKSIPDLTYLDNITDAIKKFIEKKMLPQISDMKDRSYIDPKTEKEVMKYVIELKNGSDPEYVKSFIYKNTQLQKTNTISMEIIKDFNPKRISYKEYLIRFLDIRMTTKLSYYYNKLSKVNTKYHEMDAFVKLLESGQINEILEMIQSNNKTDDELVKYLSDLLDITDFQATYIINQNIRKLSLYHLDNYRAKREEYESLRKEYIHMIEDEDALLQEIEDELIEFKLKYGKQRKSKIISKAEMINVPKGRFKLIITEKNCIKKVPDTASIGSFRDDKPRLIIEGDNEQNILIFCMEGKVYKLPIHKIPLCQGNSNGTPLNMISNKLIGSIVTVMYEPALESLTKLNRPYFISVATKYGYIKKMDIDDFLAVPPSGIIYSKLNEGDYISNISIIGAGADIILTNNTDKVLRLNSNDIPHLKRSTKGNITFSNTVENQANEVNKMSIIKPDDTDVVVITDSGKVNRLSIAALPCGKRNTTGNKVIKLSKGDHINCVITTRQNKTLLLETQNGNIELKVSDLPLGSSMSAGNKVINKNDIILSCNII